MAVERAHTPNTSLARQRGETRVLHDFARTSIEKLFARTSGEAAMMKALRAALLCGTAACAVGAGARLNVIMIVADDLGKGPPSASCRAVHFIVCVLHGRWVALLTELPIPPTA